MQQTGKGVRASNVWTCGIAVAIVLAIGAYFFGSHRQPEAEKDARAVLARQAAARMDGVRCIGERASPAQKDAIARMLAVNTVAPRGALPAWLPTDFAVPSEGPSGADAWQALSAACPDAPAFGTPFGFPSAEIEEALRADPVFADASARQWAAIRQFQAAAR